MFSACTTYEKQLRIEKMRLSHQVWSHGGSTLKKKNIKRQFFPPCRNWPIYATISIIKKMQYYFGIFLKIHLIWKPDPSLRIRIIKMWLCPTSSDMPADSSGETKVREWDVSQVLFFPASTRKVTIKMWIHFSDGIKKSIMSTDRNSKWLGFIFPNLMASAGLKRV